MAFVFGVVLFAFGIGVSIALHELGHLAIAKLFGMKVRRYFVGFGPKIWSTRKGETEYGLKAIPAGGFCDIAGMTALDELAPDEWDRAMYRQSAWKRITVMMGGPITHFALGLVLIYILAVGWGLPDLNLTTDATVGKTTCVAPTQDVSGVYSPCAGVGPAESAGLREGDTITAVNGVETDTFDEVVQETQKLSGTVDFSITRDGEDLVIPVRIEQAQRYVLRDGSTQPTSATVGAIGVSRAPILPAQYNAFTAVPASVAFSGDMAVLTWQKLLDFPEKIPAVVRSIAGGERDQDSPISVVGASRIGGEVAERGLWEVFILLLASLNFFIGIFNLLPLLPLDGGHMAVTVYEKIRDWINKVRGKPKGSPVDYTKLLPLTYVVILIGGGITLLTITADIVNPIELFP